MANGNVLEDYEDVWRCVERSYRNGYCWSERGLQAALYAELRKIRGVNVVVEPTWESARPDLVIVRNNKITDIFEIKFSPHTEFPDCWFADDTRSDVQKLRGYIGKEYPVCLEPKTGQWDQSHCLPVQGDCRLHFVAVARRGVDEQWPPCDGVTRWCGCTGDRFPDNWYIDFA